MSRREIIAQQLRTPISSPGYMVRHSPIDFGTGSSSQSGGGGQGGGQGGITPENWGNLWDMGATGYDKLFGADAVVPASTEQTYGDFTIPAGTGGEFNAPAAEGGGWMDSVSGTFGQGGGEGASGSLMSNPYGLAALIIGSANVMHNKGISPWSETLKGKAGGNLVDYYQDGGHGIGSKILDKDGATGRGTKGLTDFLELDFSNALRNSGKSLENLFRGRLF